MSSGKCFHMADILGEEWRSCVDLGTRQDKKLIL